MHVNIPNAIGALNAENDTLSRMISYGKGSATGEINSIIADDSLQGQFFDAAKKYFQYIGSPLHDKYIGVVEAKKSGNDAYIQALRRLEPYGPVVDLEQLSQQRNEIRETQNQWTAFADTVSPYCGIFSGAVSDGIEGLSDLFFGGSARKLDEMIAACNRFKSEIAECYALFDSRNADIKGVLAAAQSVCGANGGKYNFNTAETRNWAKVSGHEVDLGVGDNCPDWAKETFCPPPDSEGYIEDTYESFRTANGSIASVATWNRPGEVSCSFYTLRKLRERGLGYPFLHSGANGSQWFDNCDDSVPGARGRDCVRDLFDQYGELTNVVVSFPNGTWGHVLLIDRAYLGSDGQLHVVWSDNWRESDGAPLSDPAGTTEVRDMTYEQFLKKYSWSGDPTGARYIGGPSPN